MQRTVFALCMTIALANPSVNAIVFANAQMQTLQSFLAEARGEMQP